MSQRPKVSLSAGTGRAGLFVKFDESRSVLERLKHEVVVETDAVPLSITLDLQLAWPLPPGTYALEGAMVFGRRNGNRFHVAF
jgi:hypothetical protein